MSNIYFEALFEQIGYEITLSDDDEMFELMMLYINIDDFHINQIFDEAITEFYYLNENTLFEEFVPNPTLNKKQQSVINKATEIGKTRARAEIRRMATDVNQKGLIQKGLERIGNSNIKQSLKNGINKAMAYKFGGAKSLDDTAFGQNLRKFGKSAVNFTTDKIINPTKQHLGYAIMKHAGNNLKKNVDMSANQTGKIVKQQYQREEGGWKEKARQAIRNKGLKYGALAGAGISAAVGNIPLAAGLLATSRLAPKTPFGSPEERNNNALRSAQANVRLLNLGKMIRGKKEEQNQQNQP